MQSLSAAQSQIIRVLGIFVVKIEESFVKFLSKTSKSHTNFGNNQLITYGV